MKVVKATLPDYLKEIELHILADTHIGDSNCDIKLIKDRIDYISKTENAYCILNGDLIDNATRTSIGDVYSQKYKPMEQLRVAEEIFNPLQNKIIAVTPGNHESRTYRTEGIDLSYLLSSQLGVSDRYTPDSAFIFLRFGELPKRHRRILYTIYCKHGRASGRKEGSKINRLVEMSSIIDADIYIHSHTHMPAIVKTGYFRVDNKNSSVGQISRMFVNTAAALNYGGYGDTNEYSPSSTDTPVIYLNGTEKDMRSLL